MKYYIGIDLGGTNIAAGVVNENKEIVAKTSIKTGSGRDVNLIVDDMALAAKLPLKAQTLHLTMWNGSASAHRVPQIKQPVSSNIQTTSTGTMYRSFPCWKSAPAKKCSSKTTQMLRHTVNMLQALQKTQIRLSW